MTKISRLTISGFRGIARTLELDLKRGSGAASMILHGDNGCGKSSITDSWEWLTTGRIAHLAREGAKESSYPHLLSDPKLIYVEIECTENHVGTIRKTFHPDRVTQPSVSGRMKVLREKIKHQCHLRFNDLSRFVYYTKTERFDALAELMGFVPQVTFQKSLRKVENRLKDRYDRQQANRDEAEAALSQVLASTPRDEESILTRLAQELCSLGFDCAPELDQVKTNRRKLYEAISSDPKANRLQSLESVSTECSKLAFKTSWMTKCSTFSESAIPFKDREEDLKNLLSIELLQKAEVLVKQTGRKDFCPLCLREFPGDMESHIAEHLSSLSELKQHVEKLRQLQRDASAAFGDVGSYVEKLETLKNTKAWEYAELPENFFAENGRALDSAVELVGSFVKLDISAFDDTAVSQFRVAVTDLRHAVEVFNAALVDAQDRVATLIKGLQSDGKRKRMVDSHSRILEIISKWKDFNKKDRDLKALKLTLDQFVAVVSSYVQASTDDVDRRFGRISMNVARYFAILEEHTAGLGSPELKLLHTQDRSVTLEIEFHGEKISPAYKYLSESQLNSFGLAVFLASVREFNSAFKVLILDDIVNSFDAYKRPQVIRLLKECFEDFQILVFTHDQIWRDQLFRSFSNWIRQELYDYTFALGPQLRQGLTSVERIRVLCKDDKPVDAGAALGYYMEARLLEICESFEVLVKLKVKSDYTLEPLLTRLKARVVDKLGAQSQIAAQLERIWQDSVFRNFCAHFKSPHAHYTKEEIVLCLENWLAFESLVYCDEPRCGEVLHYNPKIKGFVCRCGRKSVSKQ